MEARDWQLEISADGRSIVQSDGSPFFWLGDTVWDLFVRLGREETKEYLVHRSQQGFTVIQAVALMGYHIPFNSENVYGHKPFVDGDPRRPDVRGSENYWTHVDFVLETAVRCGLYLALLPTWGEFVCGRQPAFDQQSLVAYVSWIAERYRDRPNLIWVNGGDTDLRLHEYADVPIWDAAGRQLKESDPNHLVTYHPRGQCTSSTEFHNCEWLDFNTYQTGHAKRYGRGDCFVDHDWALSPVKPTMDSESCYEQHPVNWNFENGNIDDHDVRRAAYGALMAGACGHTYGHVNVWCFHRPEDKLPELDRVEMPHNLHWKEQLDCPGAWQMQIAKSLFLSRPFLPRRPVQSFLLDVSGGQRALLGNGFLFAYSPCGDPIDLDASRLPWTDHICWWFDPRTGASHRASLQAHGDGVRAIPPGVPYRGNDWVLVIDDAAKGCGPPGAASV